MSSQDANACPPFIRGGGHGEGFTLRASKAIAATVAAVGSVLLAAGCAARVPRAAQRRPPRAALLPAAPLGTTTDWSTATSATAGGGMDALIAAAKKEGHLNVITLPADWANYGTIMKDFTAKYGIKITDANPDGTSQDELNAIAADQGPEPRARRRGRGHRLRRQGPDGRRLGALRGRHLERHPRQLQGADRPLLRRLRRLRGHRVRQLPGEERRRPRSSRCSPARTRTWSR